MLDVPLKKEIKSIYLSIYLSISVYLLQSALRGVMAKVMDCGLDMSEFEPRSRKYIHFRTNTPVKVSTPLSPPQL